LQPDIQIVHTIFVCSYFIFKGHFKKCYLGTQVGTYLRVVIITNLNSKIYELLHSWYRKEETLFKCTWQHI
jgi:hypothetical protein